MPDKLGTSHARSPALTRLRCGTRTASTLDAGLCAGSVRLSADLRGVEHPASQAGKLDFFLSSTRSFQQQQIPASGPQQTRVASGHINAPHVRRSLRLGENRALHWFSNSEIFSRAKSEVTVWVYTENAGLPAVRTTALSRN